MRRVPHTSSWWVHFRRPQLHLLNSYEVERAYLVAHDPDRAPF